MSVDLIFGTWTGSLYPMLLCNLDFSLIAMLFCIFQGLRKAFEVPGSPLLGWIDATKGSKVLMAEWV